MKLHLIKILSIMKLHIMLVIFVPCQACLAFDHKNVIFETQLKDFSEDYERAVEILFEKHEKLSGRKITLGDKKRVGLKVYCESGPLLSTPLALVDGIIKALNVRGITNSQIVIVGLREKTLRDAGFLPSLSSRGEKSYKGCEVLGLDSGRYYDDDWFYESPLNAKNALNPYDMLTNRKSFLPTLFCYGVDFWINLPMISSHKNIAVCGALVNASILNVSNYGRFFDNPRHAEIAIAEISAIPELFETQIFTIVSLERYQCVGGLAFNRYYSDSLPILLLSKNTPALDFYAIKFINESRRKHKLKEILFPPQAINYSQQLDIGDFSAARILRVD